MHAWIARALLAVPALASVLPSEAGAGDPLRDVAVPTVAQPIGFARPLLRSGGRTSVVYTTDVKNASSVHVTTCTDVACSTGTSRLVDNAFNYFDTPAFLPRPNGRPLIVTTGFAAGGYGLYDCGDLDCSFRVVTPVPGAGFGFLSGAAILSTGTIAVLFEGAFGGPNSRDLMVLACGAMPASCATGTASVLYDVNPATNEFFYGTEIAPGPGGAFAVAALRTLTGGTADAGYEIVSCASAGCPNPKPRLVSGPTATSYPQTVAIAVRGDGRPLALDAQPGRRVLIDCLDAACTDYLAHPLPASVEGTPVGLAVDAQGHARFGVSAPGEIGFFICADSTCSSGQRRVTSTPTNSLGPAKLASDVNGSLALAYVDAATRSLRLVTLDQSSLPLFADDFEGP